MASTYKRADSPFIWIRYKSPSGAWKSANTGYRQDNIGDHKQAERLAKRKSLEEMANKPVRVASHRWEDWGIPWINGRWGNRSNRTPKMYTNYFWRWLDYFEEIDVTQPVALRREHVVNYLEWRKKHGGGRNTAIHEIKFLGMLMDEAISRGYASLNPARKLHLEKFAPVEKVAWSDFEVDRVGVALAERSKFGWMHVTFLTGLWSLPSGSASSVSNSGLAYRFSTPDHRLSAGKSEGWARLLAADRSKFLSYLAGACRASAINRRI